MLPMTKLVVPLGAVPDFLLGFKRKLAQTKGCRGQVFFSYVLLGLAACFLLASPMAMLAGQAWAQESAEPLYGGVSQWKTGQLQDFSGTSQTENLLRYASMPPPQETKISEHQLRGWLANTNPDFAGKLAHLPKNQILEIKGSWDDAGHIMRGFGVPYTRVSGDDLGKMPLSQTRVLVVDCGCSLPF
jgi:hypothetical protein